MSEELTPTPDDLDAYLDEMLTPEERRRFEARLAEDARLGEEVEIARRIDESLARQFAPPRADQRFLSLLRNEPQQDDAETRAEAEVRPARTDRRRWLVAAAALLVCASAWTVLAVRHFAPKPERPPLYASRTLAEIYEETVADGFEPLWLCEDDREFAMTFAERQGRALLLAEFPAGIRMAGLSYPRGFTPHATAMLAWVAKTPVMVFVERIDRIDRPLEPPPASSGLRMFEKELDELRIVEVTPLDRPQVMDYLYAAEVPDAGASTSGERRKEGRGTGDEGRGTG